jgi:hypothetical protein
MGLLGRWIGFWTDSDGMSRIFGPGLRRAPKDEHWTVIGHVEEETVGVGLWVVIRDIKSTPSELQVAMHSKPPAAVLVRWEAVEGMVVWKDEPAAEVGARDIGFRLQGDAG